MASAAASAVAGAAAVVTDRSIVKSQWLIGGRWLPVASSGTTFSVRNPASGLLLAELPLCGLAETRAAIQAAANAAPAWAATTAGHRSAVLRRWHSLMVEKHAEDLARLMVAEQGKPLAEARGEVGYAASFLDWFAEEARRVYGDTIPTHAEGSRLLVHKQPVGVTAAITPWNFPLAMITRKAGAALAAGCPMVIKPSELTPLSALALAELAMQAGVPEGVLSVIGGDAPAIGTEMCESLDVRKLSFTGSTSVGKLLMRQCAGTVKRMSMELGGNAPFLVFDDADLDAAWSGAMISKFRNAGQTCVCTNRFLVHSSVKDRFAQGLAERAGKLVIGDGLAGHSDQGPLINEAAVQKCERHVADAIAKGAILLAGGKRHSLGGTFFQPTVLDRCTPDMLIYSEETFGPVAAIFSFENEAEAVMMANDTRSGLAAYAYTKDYARIFRLGERLEYGMVGANTGLVSTCVAPFGGVKESGLGREGSKYGIDEYLDVKYLCIGGVSA